MPPLIKRSNDYDRSEEAPEKTPCTTVRALTLNFTFSVKAKVKAKDWDNDTDSEEL